MNGTLRVIGGESDIRFSAALDYSTSSGDFYQGGFKRGAELWLQHFIRDIDAAALDRDRLVLPILFLFRHYLELRFKEIIMYGGRILGEDSNWPFGHDLADLWQRCRNVCERIYGSDHADHLQFLDNCFDDICHLDPTSENFRYPIDRHGDPLFQHVVIGLRNLNTALHDAGEFLEGITMDISVRLGHLDEGKDKKKFNYVLESHIGPLSAGHRSPLVESAAHLVQRGGSGGAEW